MGADPYPSVCWQTLRLQSVNSNYDCNVDLHDSALSHPPPIAAAFHSYIDRFGFGVAGDAPPAAAAPRSLQRGAATPPPPSLEPPMNAPPEAVAAGAERRFLILDQTGDGTSILFSSMGPSFWSLNHRSPKPKPSEKRGIGVGGDVPLPGGSYVLPVNYLSGGATEEVSDGRGCSAMREDTDEIDALLYSSDSEFEEGGTEGEEASTGGGQLPEGPTASAEEVGSNSVPTKRRKLVASEEEEAMDASLMDTASSARVQEPGTRHKDGMGNRGSSDDDDDDDDESSCVGGVREAEQGPPPPPPPKAGKGLKRERIQETVCVLRKIIPGGKGKDDAAVLDEAIQYLRSLKLKAKALGNKRK